jgi:hypothetical protein
MIAAGNRVIAAMHTVVFGIVLGATLTAGIHLTVARVIPRVGRSEKVLGAIVGRGLLAGQAPEEIQDHLDGRWTSSWTRKPAPGLVCARERHACGAVTWKPLRPRQIGHSSVGMIVDDSTPITSASWSRGDDASILITTSRRKVVARALGQGGRRSPSGFTLSNDGRR